MSLSKEVRERAEAFFEAGDYATAQQVVESVGGTWPKDFVEIDSSSSLEQKEDRYLRPPKPRVRRKRHVVRRSEVQKRFNEMFPRACESQEAKRKSGV